MHYDLRFKPRAVRDLERLPRPLAQRVIAKIEAMREDLHGDVKRLTNFSPEYRLRVGDYRVLFDLESSNVIIYRVIHRRDAYGR
ncbi:MAG: type II toxin-antitoxin system RelE/ParE family toxin [Phycisphaeraceae bacterium]